jgi:hypothetical protein
MDYSAAFSPSFKANTFSTAAIPGVDYKSAGNYNLSNINFDAAKSITADTSGFNSAATPGTESPAWKFITAPEGISWDMANVVQRVDMFGTNNPPVVSGTKGMRKLSLSNCLVEGFVRGVTVEGKIAALEKLTDYSLNTESGFVNVPVYQLWANEKAYGNTGFFVIESIKVTEKLRDLRGDATRALVDIALTQVPEYQVGSGRDQANQGFAGAKAKALPAQEQAQQVKGGRNGNRSGGNAAAPSKPPAGSVLKSQVDNLRTGTRTLNYQLPNGGTYKVVERIQ